MKLSMLSASVAMALLAVGHGSSWSLGLGEARALSGLNQPLKAEVEVLADAAELGSIKLSLASPDAYRQQGLDFPAALAGAQVNLVKRSGARPVALISAAAPFQEPYVTIMLDGQSANGKVRRVYSVFIDPANSAPAAKLPGESSFVEGQQKLPILPPLVKGEKGAQASDQKASVAVAAAPVAASPAAAVEPEQVMYTNISEVGDAPKKLDAVQGYGKGVAIKHAFFTVAPKGWKGFSGDKALKIAGKVSWAAGRTWTQTLDGILADAHMSAVVNWSKKEITFYGLDGAAKAAAASAAAAVVAAPAAAVAPVAANAPAAPAATAAAAAPVAAEAAAPAASAPTAEVVVSTSASQVTDAVAGVQAELSQVRGQLSNAERMLSEAQAAAKAAEASRAQAQTKLDEQTARADGLSEELAKAGREKAELEKAQAAASVKPVAIEDAAKAEAAKADAAAQAEKAEAAAKAEKAEAAAKLEQAEQAMKAAATKRDQALSRLAESEAKSKALADEGDKSRRDLTAEIEALRAQLEQAQAKAKSEQADREHYQAQNKHLLHSLDATRDWMSKMRWGMPEPTPVKSAAFSSLRLVNGDMIQENMIGSAGLNVSLSSALNQIIPAGWMVISGADVGTPAVSWTGGHRPWIQVLDDILKSQNLTATVDAVTREIQVAPAASK